ncbi:hypothetical protein CAP47_03380 [Psychroflexus sp. S27]|nr:hypothetical protein CAP47_03380 [Psychroflexus sp. S27]
MRILYLLFALVLISCQSTKNKPMTETICQEKFHCEAEFEKGKNLIEVQDGIGAMYLKTRVDENYDIMYMSVNSNDPNLAYAADLKSYKISFSYPAQSELTRDKMSIYVQTFCKCDEAGVRKIDSFEVSRKKINSSEVTYIKSEAFSFLKDQTLVLKN